MSTRVAAFDSANLRQSLPSVAPSATNMLKPAQLESAKQAVATTEAGRPAVVHEMSLPTVSTPGLKENPAGVPPTHAAGRQQAEGGPSKGGRSKGAAMAVLAVH